MDRIRTFFSDRSRNGKLLNAASLFTCFLFPYAAFILMEIMHPRSPVSWLAEYVITRTKPFLPSWILISILMILVMFLTERVWISCAVVAVTSLIASYSNYYKTLWWNVPVMPQDLKNIKAGVTAVGLTTAYPTKRMILAAVVFAALVLCVSLLRFHTEKRPLRWVFSGISALLIPVIFAAFFISSAGRSLFGFDEPRTNSDLYYQKTFYSAFLSLMNEQLIDPPTPDGYSADRMEEITEEISAVSAGMSGTGTPDIIVVLLESYYDVTDLGYEFDIDINANYTAAAKEGFSGRILTPLYGGGTSNAEFEVLTCLATDNAYINSMAYNDICYPGFPGIVNYLSDRGYRSLAIHSFTSALFNRINAYSYLGFDSSEFIEDFDPENTTTARDFVSDLGSIKEVELRYEQMAAADESPVFINLVTMQNHLPFEQASDYLESQGYNIVHTVDPGLDPAAVSDLEGFATLTKLTDDAIGEACDYFSNVDRDVILVFYGDHQTTFNTGLYSEFSDGVDGYLRTHSTPYLVWSNHSDITGTFGLIPMNQLLAHTLRAYNVSRPAYYDWMLDGAFNGDVTGVFGNHVLLTSGGIGDLADYTSETEEYYDLLFDISSGKKLAADAYTY